MGYIINFAIRLICSGNISFSVVSASFTSLLTAYPDSCRSISIIVYLISNFSRILFRSAYSSRFLVLIIPYFSFSSLSCFPVSACLLTGPLSFRFITSRFRIVSCNSGFCSTDIFYLSVRSRGRRVSIHRFIRVTARIIVSQEKDLLLFLLNRCRCGAGGSVLGTCGYRRVL